MGSSGIQRSCWLFRRFCFSISLATDAGSGVILHARGLLAAIKACTGKVLRGFELKLFNLCLLQFKVRNKQHYVAEPGVGCLQETIPSVLFKPGRKATPRAPEIHTRTPSAHTFIMENLAKGLLLRVAEVIMFHRSPRCREKSRLSSLQPAFLFASSTLTQGIVIQGLNVPQRSQTDQDLQTEPNRTATNRQKVHWRCGSEWKRGHPVKKQLKAWASAASTSGPAPRVWSHGQCHLRNTIAF